MRVAICEDENKYVNQLVGYIKEWAETKNILVEIFTYITAEKFLYENDYFQNITNSCILYFSAKKARA